ncbi:MAG: hypothetical protein Q4C53_06595 [Clostridia bacterium]|nr:hypothetical protein [Clostridia bacterium]
MEGKKFPTRRFVVMMAGLIIMAFGISLFKFSLTGNDPCNALFLATSSFLGIDYSVCGLAMNVFYFVFEIWLFRKHIGIGTFANWFCVVPVAEFIMRSLTPVLPVADTLALKLMYLVPGVLVLSLSVSMYQSADLGIAPYDALAMILSERTKLPYFGARIITDGVCALVTYLLGGLIGLGTLICAFGLGPFVTFFDRTVSRPLLGMKGER